MRSRFMVVMTAAALAVGMFVSWQVIGVAAPAPSMAVDKAEQLRADMRKLWEDHVTWTRLFIVSAVAGLPDMQSTLGRLLQNQTDLGNAIKPFFGEAAGNQLSVLLRDHITIAGDLVVAAKAGNNAGAADARRRWFANASDIATFLSSANPAWRQADLRAMLNEHLSLTEVEATARIKQDWVLDIATYDKIHIQALHMADALSAGIIARFPEAFR